MPSAAQGARVADRPRIEATVHPDATGTLTVNGTPYPCAADTVERLVAGITARCVAVATTLSRPVGLRLTEGSTLRSLAVRPDGFVQTLHDDGTPDPTSTFVVDDSPCRRCRAAQPITTTTCHGCGALEPHRVELASLVVQDAQWLTAPEEHLGAGPATPPERRSTRPTLHLTFSSQAPVTLHENAALGRNPGAVPGRRQVQVESPSFMVSKTHLLVDVDEAGRVLVTDCRSANGTSIRSEPPVQLEPGRPYEIRSGTELRLGDVTCTIAVIPAG
jgi:FHA domain